MPVLSIAIVITFIVCAVVFAALGFLCAWSLREVEKDSFERIEAEVTRLTKENEKLLETIALRMKRGESTGRPPKIVTAEHKAVTLPGKIPESSPWYGLDSTRLDGVQPFLFPAETEPRREESGQ